ncbi:MAG: hypothetical protein EON48_06055 [Acetobacteraceae bacterium]|nr:MAG: hypothetical protein EON48_06055 [Acetobacteraceae bacterium]
MNTIPRVLIAVSALVLAAHLPLAGAVEPGKTAQPTPPDQVPKGLAKSDWRSIHAAYEAGRHAFQPIEGGWQARNPGQQWTTKFDRRGFVAEPRDGGWQWGLELRSYGYTGQVRTISGTPAVKADGQRLSCQRDAALQEWWVNDARGLEHGFTVLERPAAPPGAQASPLHFLLAVRGSLVAEVGADGQGVEFRDAAGTTVLTYAGLTVWDADGRLFSSRFAPAEGGVRLLVEEHGARYPLTIDPIAQQAYLKPGAFGSKQAGDIFGVAVAVSGDTVVIGAYEEDSGSTGVNSTPDESAPGSGAAYVYVRSAGVWTQQAYLKPAAVGTSQAGDSFGYSVAVAGDTVVVGAPYEGSDSTGVNSAPNEDVFHSGAAYVYVRSGSAWTQQAYLKPAAVGTSQDSDQFGWSVAVSGDTVVVGANLEDSSTTGVNSTPNDDGNASSSGAAYVFARSGSAWTQEAYLKPAAVGTSQVNDQFGYSVAVSGDTVVVGAWLEDSSSLGVNSTPDESAGLSGAACVFVRGAGVWTQQAYLKPAIVGTMQGGDNFGFSVGVSGDTVVVGAPAEASSTTGVNSTPNEGASFAGAAYVFQRSATVWTQQAYLKPAAVGASQVNDQFGYSVGVSGDTVVVGAVGERSATTGVNSTPNEDVNAAGAACVFVRSANAWTQQAYLKPAAVGTSQGNDQAGWSVAISGDTVVVGAVGEDSGSAGVNSTPDESASFSGAAYVFSGFGPVDDGPFAIISIVLSGPNAHITFPTITGKSYTLSRSDTLTPALWIDTGLAAIPGDGTDKTFITPAPVAGVPKRFYRVTVKNEFP